MSDQAADNKIIYSLKFDKIIYDNLEKDNFVQSLPTLSKRKKSATNILNELLKEQPECANTVYALLTYAPQKWAKYARTMIGINEDTTVKLTSEITDAIALLNNIYKKTKITPKVGNEYIKRVDDADKILKCIEDSVNWLSTTPKVGDNFSKTVKAIHYMDEDLEDVSSFLVNSYYKDAVLEIYYGFGEKIDEQVTQLTSYSWLKGGGGNRYSDVFHNTQLLLDIYPHLMHRFKRRVNIENFSCGAIQRDANELYLLSVLEKSVGALRLYPDGGNELCEIIICILKGMSDRDIQANFKMNYNTLYNKKAKAINLLSFVLWGYSTTQILNGLVSVPQKKKELSYIL